MFNKVLPKLMCSGSSLHFCPENIKVLNQKSHVLIAVFFKLQNLSTPFLEFIFVTVNKCILKKIILDQRIIYQLAYFIIEFKINFLKFQTSYLHLNKTTYMCVCAYVYLCVCVHMCVYVLNPPV